MIGKLIGGFIVILVGTSLLPEFHKGLDLIGWTVDKEPEKERKQTYLEYVKERREVERLMK